MTVSRLPTVGYANERIFYQNFKLAFQCIYATANHRQDLSEKCRTKNVKDEHLNG
jgi:hypothetical protein